MSIQPRHLFIKGESPAGTPVVPVAADVQHFNACNFTPGGPGPIDRQALLPAYDTLPADCLPFEFWQVALEQSVKHAVAPDAALEIEPQLLAAGFGATPDAGVDRTYDLLADPNVDGGANTVYLEENAAGDLYEASGVRWGVVFSGDNAGRLNVAFNGVGRFKPAGAFTPITVAPGDYHAGKNFCNLGGAGAFSWFGYNLIAQAFTVDVGMTPETRDNMGADAADYDLEWPAHLSRGTSPRQAVNGSLTFEGVKESVFALWSNYSTVAQGPGVITYSRGGASLTFNFPVVVLRPPQPAYEGAKKMWTVPFSAHYDVANAAGAIQLVSVGATP